MNNSQIARTLFVALACHDDNTIESVCAPDMQTNQSQGPNMSVSTLLQFNQAVQNVVKNFRYKNAIRSATETGFVEEHNVRGTLPDGNKMDLAVCVVADVQDGKIVRMREYVDSRAAAGLLKALSA